MRGNLLKSRAVAGLLATALGLGILATPWWRHVELKILDALVDADDGHRQPRR